MHDKQVRAHFWHRLPKWLAFLALTAFPGCLGAAREAHAFPWPQGQYPYATYGEAHGYGPFPTHAIAQDARGVLWLASDNGLHLFDGRAIVPLSLPASLPSSLVSRLLPGASGSMWCLTGAGLLHALDGHFVGPEFPGLLGKVLSAASPSPEILWVGTDQALFRLLPGDRFEPVSGFSGRPIHSLWLNPQGDFIVGGLGSLTIGSKDGAPRHIDKTQGLSNEAITGVAKDRAGRIWFHSRRRLWSLSLEPFSLEEKTADYQNPWFLSLTSDSEGRLWLGTTTSILVIDGEGPPRREALPESHGVRSIFEDIEGSMWIGSFGLHRILGRGQWRIFGKAQGLTTLSIWGITRDAEGTLWATTTKGLFRAQGKTGQFEPVEALNNKTLTTAAAGSDGALWLGCRGPEILRYQPQNGELSAYPLPLALADTRVIRLIQDREGRFWAASTAGLYRSEDAQHLGQFIRIALPNEENAKHITDIMADSRGRIWFGTEKGVGVVEGERIRRFSADDGLSASISAFVTERKDGRICMTRGEIKGIRCFFYENEIVRISDDFDRSSGLTSDTIYLMGTDLQDRLWVGSARGLDVIEGDKVVAAYDHRNGLPNDDINGWSMLVEDDGDLWFGTAGGIAHFHEEKRQKKPPLPQPVWTEVRLGGLSVNMLGKPEVEYARNTLEADLIVPTFLWGDTANTNISVRLSGVLPEWEKLSTPVFRYAGLDPGDYVLEARAQRPHEPWGPQARFLFSIAKPFYRTWPFRIAFVVMLLGLGALVPLAQRRALRKRNAMLQDLVDERTRALSEAHARLLELSKWATEEQMAGGFAHEIRNALAGAKMVLSSVFDSENPGGETLCAENAQKLKALFLELRDKLSPQDRKNTANILKEINAGEERLDGAIRNADAAVDRALTITRQILLYSKLGAEKPVDEMIRPGELVERIFNIYRNDWQNDRIFASSEIGPEIEVRMGESHFISIVQNIVSNASDALREKNEGERKIRIGFSRSVSGWTLLIEDSGIGIDPEHLKRLFEPFFSTKPSTGTGLGLGIVRRLCRLYGGDVRVKSEPGRGTQFEIFIPNDPPNQSALRATPGGAPEPS